MINETKIFSTTKNMKKLCLIFCVIFRASIDNLKNLKCHTSLVFSIICSKCKNENEKIFKKKIQLRY